MIKIWKQWFGFLVPTFYGGGAPSSTTSTVTQSQIPDWLQPQTEAMLGSATQQIFNVDGKGNITGIKGYTPYSSDPNAYVAGPSWLQQSSYNQAANMQVPGQIGTGTNMVSNSVNQGAATGNAAMGLSNQLSQAGGNYAAQATDPNSVAAYMSPYMQNVVDMQKASALRDFDIQQQSRNADASRNAAFGGSRQAIVDAEAQRNLGFQTQQLEATGLQNAFQNAQQAQQFAAQQNLQGLQGGLQGIQTAQQGYGMGLQGASTLGNLGAQQLSSQENIANLQNQFGQQQTQRQQDIINNAINNYAMQQQYPMQQLGMYNALLRGYAVPTSAATTYQSAPSGMSQMAGLLGTGLGLYGAAGGFGTGKKKGGKIKSDGAGGLAGLAMAKAMKGG